MIIDLVTRVHVRVLLTLHRSVVGAVVETVALPGGTSKLGPLNVVLRQLARLQVDDENLLPVAAAS